MAASSSPEDLPVAELQELPAEIWAIIWRLVAAQSGFVGAWRLIGGAICKAATEGWGLQLFYLRCCVGFFPPPINVLQSSDTFYS